MPTRRKGSKQEAEDGRPLVSVLGVGQMGLVCGGLLVSQESVREALGGRLSRRVRVTLWGHSLEESGALAQTRRSPRLEGFLLPDEVDVVLKDAAAVRG